MSNEFDKSFSNEKTKPLQIDMLDYFNEETQLHVKSGLTEKVGGLVGSEILKIASEIRAMQANGLDICNLTVGDFSSSQFPIPELLRDLIQKALLEGHTNYPPSDGVLELRNAVVSIYEKYFNLKYPVSSVLIAGGARPIIYAIYNAFVDSGDKVIYPVPSWNNNHYCYMSKASSIEIISNPENNFMPTSDMIIPHIKTARLLCLNTPLNPTGTMISQEEAKKITKICIEENNRRKNNNEKPLYIMYDHIYWMLTFGSSEHITLQEISPEIAPYVIFVDGISKCLASTGLRVGWAVGHPYVISKMKDFLGHVGAWAPKPEQVATANFLNQEKELDSYLLEMKQSLQKRLDALYKVFFQLKEDGFDVDVLSPQGAIYLSVRFNLFNKYADDGVEFTTNEQIRKYILDKAGVAIVPFQAFGLKEDTGWFRLSVGAVSVEQIEASFPRLREMLSGIR